MRRPSLPVLVIAGLVALGVGFTLLTSSGTVPPGQGTPVAARDLRFEDRLDGAIAVYEGAGTQPLTLLAPGTNAFVRTTLRGMARERRLKETAEPEMTPFRLTLWPNGRLTLEDLATSRTLDLRAYGEDNALAFAQLLPAREATR